MQHMNKTQLPLWGSITQGGRLYSPLQAPWLSTEPLTPWFTDCQFEVCQHYQTGGFRTKKKNPTRTQAQVH